MIRSHEAVTLRVTRVRGFVQTTGLSITQPDITLFLDVHGTIEKAALSNALSGESVDSWLGRPWADTVDGIAGDKVRDMVMHACATGVSAFGTVIQRLPSGTELSIEYTTVLLGDGAGLIAVGRSLQAVAGVEARLLEAQAGMERDHWRLRMVETRYRQLLDTSNEAVVRVADPLLRVVEANPVATRALGLTATGGSFLEELPAGEREVLKRMLQRVSEDGSAPGMLVTLGPNRRPWLLRASAVSAGPELSYLLMLAPAGGAEAAAPAGDRPIFEKLIDKVPDGFLVLDESGGIVWTNDAFLDLVQVGAKESVLGEHIGRWLGHHGTEATVLLTSVRRHGSIRLFTTTLRSEFGASTEVDISASITNDRHERHIGLLLRYVGHDGRIAGREDTFGSRLRAVTGRVGQVPLPQMVEELVTLVERHCIETALEVKRGNRSAAATLLGLSRASFYAKLTRHGVPRRHPAIPAD